MGLSRELILTYNRKPITFPEDGNPFWPLPADYPNLSERGKRLARLNAVCNQSTAHNFVAAWHFFRTYYLAQLPPGVFYKRWKPSPKLHYQLVWDLATYSRNAWAAPRASAKSTVLGKEVPIWLLCSRPHYDILMVLAKDPFIVKRFGTFMSMLEHNQFICDDFGELKPARGNKAWNHHLLQLENGSAITGLPVEGKMLGERPDLILPDDPEHDKSMVQNPNPSALLEAFERLLFGTLLPMLDEGAAIGWIGTLLSNRSFLYYVTQSGDPRFAYWNKRVTAIKSETGELAWEAKWPPKVIHALREQLGEAEFLRQYMNRPGASQEALLKIDEDYCVYQVEDADGDVLERPFQTSAKLLVKRPERTDTLGQYNTQLIERNYAEAVGKMYRIITVDYGYTTKETSDFSAIHVMGLENSEYFKDTIYSLDMWLGKEPVGVVLRKIWEMAKKWRVHVIAPEAVSIQQALADQLISQGDMFEAQEGWRPWVQPIKYRERMDKGARIAGALEWRFNQFRIKLPVWRRFDWPYRELWGQVEEFTQDLQRLPHDDAVDSLAMIQEVVRPTGGYAERPVGEAPLSPFEDLKTGELYSPAGLLWINSMSPNEIPHRELYERYLEATTPLGNQDGESVLWLP